MDYYLNRINLVLIAAVGGLCLYQWKGEHWADGQIEDLHRATRQAEQHIAAQDEAIRGDTEDIDEFKKVIAALKAKSDAADVRIRQKTARIFTLEIDAKQHAGEAELWKKTLAAYKDAVAARDGNIGLLLDQRKQLIDANRDAAQKANQAVGAYNDLANRYAALVEQYNELAKRYKALAHPPADSKADSSRS